MCTLQCRIILVYTFSKTGQLVSFELINTDKTNCPAEISDIQVPKCDKDFDPECTGNVNIPFERSSYDKNTGQSPNSPRRQVYIMRNYEAVSNSLKFEICFLFRNSRKGTIHLT